LNSIVDYALNTDVVAEIYDRMSIILQNRFWLVCWVGSTAALQTSFQGCGGRWWNRNFDHMNG